MADDQLRILVSIQDLASAGLARLKDDLGTVGNAAATSNPKINQLSKGLDASSKAGSLFHNVLTGIGQGIGQAGFGILQEGISDAVNWFGQAAAAARDDDQSIAGLTTSLRANVDGWNGNSAAVEDYIQHAEDASAFSKDDLRKSLEQLVGATHDVTKAQELQSTAFNLARYSGVDLGTATQELVNVEAGRFRGLAALGINVKNVHDAQDALNQINSVAAGQSFAYLDTENGKLDAMNQKLHDQQVALGKNSEGWQVWATGLQINLVDVGNAITDFFGHKLADQLPDTTNNLRLNAQAMDEWSKEASGDLNWFGLQADTVFGPGGTFDMATNHALSTMAAFPSKMATDLRGGWDDVSNAAAGLAGAMKKPISELGREQDLKDTLTGKNSLGSQMIAGLKSSDPIAVGWAKQLRDDVTSERLGIEADIQFKVIQDRNTPLNGGSSGPVGSNRGGSASGGSGKKPTGGGGYKPPATPPKTHYASGGWAGLYGPEIASIGEHEPELVIPKSVLMGAGTSNGGSMVIHNHIYIDGQQIEEHVDRIAGRRLALMGTGSLGGFNG